jgi:hypothetical protein
MFSFKSVFPIKGVFPKHWIATADVETQTFDQNCIIENSMEDLYVTVGLGVTRQSSLHHMCNLIC